jgi:L-threonylcarbamoyladenylate synthase
MNPTNEVNVAHAVDILRGGDVVALPTETVYGLAADASNDLAVAKIFAIKQRPVFNPLIIHVANLKQAQEVGIFSPGALALAKKHWPGPLTIVVPKRNKNFALLATAGLDTVAIRVSAHKIMQEVLEKSGLMLAAPSANISGRLTPTEILHVTANFPDIYIVDGGKCRIGLESTVVTFDENDAPILLRQGIVQIEGAEISRGKKITSPGQLLKHYAPNSPLRINAEKSESGEIFLGFGNMECDFNLSEGADLREAAANLFSTLHKADAQGKKIAVAKIPDRDIGMAINDRLRKAAS